MTLMDAASIRVTVMQWWLIYVQSERNGHSVMRDDAEGYIDSGDGEYVYD